MSPVDLGKKRGKKRNINFSNTAPEFPLQTEMIHDFEWCFAPAWGNSGETRDMEEVRDARGTMLKEVWTSPHANSFAKQQASISVSNVPEKRSVDFRRSLDFPQGADQPAKRKRRKLRKVTDVEVVEENGCSAAQEFALCLEDGPGGGYSSKKLAGDQANSWIVFKVKNAVTLSQVRIMSMAKLNESKTQVKSFTLQRSSSLVKPGPWMDVLTVESVPASGLQCYDLGCKGISVFWRLVLIENVSTLPTA
jgi:hypothetical protein